MGNPHTLVTMVYFVTLVSLVFTVAMVTLVTIAKWGIPSQPDKSDVTGAIGKV
jgi:hypothetical protein